MRVVRVDHMVKGAVLGARNLFLLPFPHPSDSPTYPFHLSENTALEIQATEKQSIQSARQCACAFPYRNGRRVRFSSSLSSTAPASTAAEFMFP